MDQHYLAGQRQADTRALFLGGEKGHEYFLHDLVIDTAAVVGDSIGDIVKLLTWDYLKPVLMANIPAWILAWYFLGEWLEQYAQRVGMGIGLYLFGGSTILAATMIVVIALITRSALTPPIHALRCE